MTSHNFTASVPADSRPTSRARTVSAAGAAGIAGPVIFTVVWVVQELFRLEEYSPITEPVSALAAGPNGWVQSVDFALFGVLTLVFAGGLHLGVRRSRAGVVGPAFIGLSGFGLLLAAAFPLREDAAGVTYDPGGHVIAGTTFFLCSALGLIVVSRRLAHDPRWRGLATYTLVAGSLGVAAYPLMGVFVVPDDAGLHPYFGLAQRLVVLGIIFPCWVLLARRLLQVARGQR